MKILKEFKKFAVQGNVIDMAVGVVIGTAFGKIVSSLVTDIIMPPIGLLTGGIDFTHLAFTLKKATEETPEVAIHYGLFINTILDFVIIAFCIFMAIKQLNRFKKQEEIPAQATPEEVLLLREIRDSLKSRK